MPNSDSSNLRTDDQQPGKLPFLLLPIGIAVAFVVVLYVSFVFSRRNERMLGLVEFGHYPNVETSNELLTLLRGIQRGFYDAVSASDPGSLVHVDELYAKFQAKLSEADANPVADHKRLNELRRAMKEYYPFSRDTTARMIRGDGFTLLAPALETMTAQHSAIDAMLQEGLSRDREAIRAAFHSSRRIQQTTITTMACVVLACHAALLVGFLLHSRLARTTRRNQTLQRHRAELTEINDQLSRQTRAILDSAGEGIFGLDSHGQATFINPAAAHMLGWTVDELLGRNLHQMIHFSTSDPAATCVVCRGAEKRASRSDGVSEFRMRNGNAIPIDYTIRAIVADDGAPNGVVVTFRDISERRAVERMKDEFVSTVSHELRTPLTSIRGALGLLNSGLLSADRRERLLSIATNNSQRLSRLIDDILDLERIGSGKAAPRCQSIDAYELMQSAADGVLSMAEQVGVRVVVQPVQATLWLDVDRITQTLTNLLGNAIKFSLPSTTVTMSGTFTDEHFLFAVADQGRGIPQSQLEKIFERFQQVDASDSREKAGTGLGLPICRSIVEAHGGRIWAESGDGVGSTFFFTIPWQETAPAAMCLRSF